MGVTRLTGDSFLLDAKTARPDAAQAVLASSAFPHMSSPIHVGVGEIEENLVDGACGMPLPILAGVKRFRPDTLIVLAAARIPSTCRASSSGCGRCSPAPCCGICRPDCDAARRP